jgi:protein-disulfide isomerase
MKRAAAPVAAPLPTTRTKNLRSLLSILPDRQNLLALLRRQDLLATLTRGQSLQRRHLLTLAAGVGALALIGAAWWALTPRAGHESVAISGKGEGLADLMQPGPLPELALGNADAPITVVEYASMSCPHCANVHNTVLPELKKKYIDTGKVHFILREFPLDDRAMAAAMLARCAGGDKTLPLISALFARQEAWAFVRDDPLPELFKFAKQAGFTKESFDKCLSDQKLLDEIEAVRTRAARVYGVKGTPTFFVNGKRLDGVSLEDFEKAFAPILKS